MAWPTFRQLRSYVAGRKPTAAQVGEGQLAVNIPDKMIYTKDANGNIIRVACETYTRAEMNARYVLQGSLPLTRIGDTSDDPLPMLISGTGLLVNGLIPVMLAGRQYTLNPGTYSFAAVIAGSTGTKQLRIGVTLSGGAAVLDFSLTAKPESTLYVDIGFLTLNGQVATGLTIEKVTRLDTFRPSTTQRGSAFPVSTGNPSSTGTVNW